MRSMGPDTEPDAGLTHGEPRRLTWARELQALAQNGLAYAQSPFDVERYAAVRRIAVEMMAAQTGADAAALQDLFDGESGYATPKVDVRGVVFRDGRILLVRERSDGLWSLPGGWADVNESPSEVAEREVWEESGYRTRAVKLLAVWDRSRHGHPPHAFSIYKVALRCELLAGAPASSVETDGAAFFAPDDLPELSVGRVTAAQIARFFDHLHQPDLPADFD